jgi:hypothetical protein
VIVATAGAATGADRAHSVEVLEHLEDQFLRSRQVWLGRMSSCCSRPDIEVDRALEE